MRSQLKLITLHIHPMHKRQQLEYQIYIINQVENNNRILIRRRVSWVQLATRENMGSQLKLFTLHMHPILQRRQLNTQINIINQVEYNNGILIRRRDRGCVVKFFMGSISYQKEYGVSTQSVYPSHAPSASEAAVVVTHKAKLLEVETKGMWPNLS